MPTYADDDWWEERPMGDDGTPAPTQRLAGPPSMDDRGGDAWATPVTPTAGSASWDDDEDWGKPTDASPVVATPPAPPAAGPPVAPVPVASAWDDDDWDSPVASQPPAPVADRWDAPPPTSVPVPSPSASLRVAPMEPPVVVAPSEPPAVVAAPAPRPTARPVVEDDDSEMTRQRVRPTPAGPTLVLEGGQRIAITGVHIVGRNPATTEGTPVRAAGAAVSKTHFSIGLHEGRVWVCDLNSTNGTELESAEGQRVRLNPGRKTFAPVPGAVIFGDKRAALEDPQ